MAIVKELVQQLNGKLRVKSEFGKGTIFYIEIPFELISAEKLNAFKTQDQISLFSNISNISDQPKKRILLVEDSKVLQRAHSLLLKRLGFEVTISPDGETTLQHDLTNFDFVLLDIGLPGMDGYEVCRTIRLREVDSTRKIPIIALTGYDDPESVKKCFKAGANEVIAKPFDESKLLKLLSSF